MSGRFRDVHLPQPVDMLKHRAPSAQVFGGRRREPYLRINKLGSATIDGAASVPRPGIKGVETWSSDKPRQVMRGN